MLLLPSRAKERARARARVLANADKDQVCFKFRDTGKCDNKDCKYPHVKSDSKASSVDRSKIPCKWLALGKCTKGDSCWFKHSDSAPGGVALSVDYDYFVAVAVHEAMPTNELRPYEVLPVLAVPVIVSCIRKSAGKS